MRLQKIRLTKNLIREIRMKLNVCFKNGSSKEFLIESYYISDNDICLYMQRDGRDCGMINLCEVRYFFAEDIGN